MVLSTKDKILAKALTLFNEQGTDFVTVRHIANELGISHGNLCYHFANTDVIIEALYQQLVDKLNELTIQMTGLSENQLTILYQLSYRSFEILHQYRFLMLDFVRIMRRIPTLKLHFKALMQIRQEQFRHIIASMQANGFIDIPEKNIAPLIEQALLFGDFWISRAEILFDGNEQEKIAYYHKTFYALFEPYLCGNADW
ncbi:TetR/AcrR family transcriptional regulator [Flectobacillus roseus]|uniref:TetR/AcrR family transcriptional regulator n=1 Tax=Flectobacillus roseus TaxID=502259 RepID=UPI0024B77D3E|nr:TetR/AcrR family transcriptional regulator [Flectobacillus roseus]MDI9871260.1 TetR/AcrR family transcriptional regulator [Flectobacillus roseus]